MLCPISYAYTQTNLQQVFKMFVLGASTRCASCMPQVNGWVNKVLFNALPNSQIS